MNLGATFVPSLCEVEQRETSNAVSSSSEKWIQKHKEDIEIEKLHETAVSEDEEKTSAVLDCIKDEFLMRHWRPPEAN